MPDLSSIAINVAAGVLTGSITAATSVHLALRRFRAERTWDRRVAAYTEIFDALYQVQKGAKVRVRQMEEGTQFSDEYFAQVTKNAAEGYEAIRRAAIKGTFVVGEMAARKLEELVTVFDDPQYNNDFHEEITEDLAAATKAIAELRAIAKSDLSL